MSDVVKTPEMDTEEADPDDAPVYYSTSEARAWAAGWNAHLAASASAPVVGGSDE